MRYLLREDIALRSFWLVPYAYYIRHVRNAGGLTKEEFAFLSACDGETEIVMQEENQALAQRFLANDVIRPAKEKDRLSDWQKPRFCDNRYFPAINWMITGKCNCNCLHCFNVADNAPLASEWTLAEAEKLLDDAKRCGINAFTITGGEPMLHPDFFAILESIYTHDMFVEELNTNGHFITQTALDRLKAIGCRPLMKISLDGIGHHDWLRNREGAEEMALRAIRLCVENDFPVKVQTNVHRRNLASMLPTARALDEMGVEEMRIIRTTESARWEQNAKGATLGIAEYYDAMLDFASAYIQEAHTMTIEIWQFLGLMPEAKGYLIRPILCAKGKYRDSLPVCRGNRGMAAIAADGNLYPCMQMSGTYMARGSGGTLGNVKKDGLQKFLQEGSYLEEVCRTVGELARKNEKCGSCSYFKACTGGCRALAEAFTWDKLGVDPTKCLFFEQGYPEKIRETMGTWQDLRENDILL